MNTEVVNQIKEDAYKLINQIQALKKQLSEQSQEILKKITKEVFNSSPGLNAIIWTQYAPHFNDGDECIFGVHGAAYTNAIGDQLDDICGTYEYEGEDESVWFAESLYDFRNWEKYHSDHPYPDINLEMLIFFASFIHESEMQPVMEDMFGNHAKIVATREGFDVQDYDHD